MQRKNLTITDVLGNALRNVTVRIVRAGTTTPAVLFSDNGVTQKLDNDLLTDGSGNAYFYAANGRYDGIVMRAGQVLDTVRDMLLNDPADNAVDAITPRGFGAVGDGITDDTAALMAACSTGKVVNGLDLAYAIAGNFVMPPNFKGLINCELNQLTPTGSNRRTIYMNGNSDFVLGNVRINRNGNTSGGALGDDAGIYLANCTNFYTYECEVFGGGAGNGITYQSCSGFHEARSVVRDIKYVTVVAPADDVINGIWYNNCHDFTVDGSHVYDCGTVVGGVFTKQRSRGFAVSGCYKFEFYSATADRVDQGHDITGGVGNHDFAIIACKATDCYTYSFKAANSAYRGAYIACVGEGARINFINSGQSEASSPKPQGVTYTRCQSINAGKNVGYPGVPAQGFRLQSSSAVDATYPRGIIFDNCVAIDNQAIPTMEYGFASDVSTGVDPADINRVINNCRSVGHTNAATTGFNDSNNIIGVTRLDGTAPRLTLFESGATGNKKMWDIASSGGRLLLRTRTDTDTTGATYCYIDRTGATVDKITFDPAVTAFGGIATSTRYLEISNQGAVTQRFDDNGAPAFRTMANYGIAAAGQGAGFVWNLGAGGVFGATAARLRIQSTDTWAAAGNRSAKMTWELIQAGAFGPAMEYDPATGLKVGTAGVVVNFPNGITKLVPFTVATLPNAATYQWGVIAVTDGAANKRMAISDGTNWRWPDGAIVS